MSNYQQLTDLVNVYLDNERKVVDLLTSLATSDAPKYDLESLNSLAYSLRCKFTDDFDKLINEMEAKNESR